MSVHEQATTAFIGIGSNLKDPAEQVRSAMVSIGAIAGTSLESCSSLYSSPPMGPPDQPDYVNAVVRVSTALSSFELLDALQQIERHHGRVRGGARWGPRTLDLDILLFGNDTIDSDRLHVPHCGLTERAFVVVPLAEIAPDLVLPDGSAVSEIARRTAQSEVCRLPDD